MKPTKIAGLFFLLLMNGCTEKVEVATHSCSELESIKDPKVREEVAAKCIRAGGFVPSPKKTYNFN